MKSWMKQVVFFMVAAIAAASFSGCGNAKVEIPQNMTGSLYTQVTMWEDKGKTYSLNYSVTNKIPVNTEVRILSMSAKNLVLELGNSGQKVTLVNVEKYSQMGTAVLAERLFGSKKVNLSKFTKKEQAFIKSFAGFYQAGITKEALIVARGYPSQHATASLKSDTWKYWRNKWVTKNIGFENNKVKTFNGQPLQ